MAEQLRRRLIAIGADPESADWLASAAAGWTIDWGADFAAEPPPAADAKALLLWHDPPDRDALAWLRRHADAPLPPTAVIAERDVTAEAVQALKLGACDYLARRAPDFAAQLDAFLRHPEAAWSGRDAQRAALKTLERRAAHLWQLNVAGQQLAATLDAEQVMMQILHAATDLVGARDASVWAWEDGQRRQLVCRATSNRALQAVLQRQRVRVGEGIVGWVVQRGESACVLNTRRDPRFSAAVDDETGFRTESVLATPLRVGRDVLGALEIINKIDGAFDAEDIAFAEMLAVSAAGAMANAALVAELQARNAELDAFAHTVAHDLKTPLLWLTGYSDLLRQDDGRLSPTARDEYFQAITDGAHTMSAIIDDLLLLAGLRDPAAIITPIDMAEVLRAVRRRVEPLIAQHRAQFSAPEQFPSVLGYAPWLEGVWVNYISNAVKYGGQPPRVELGYCEQDDAVCFWVQDNGRGLTPEQQAQLFVPFKRLRQVRSAPGHGLGLAIVRQIVEKLGGVVGVESPPPGAPHAGSRFAFTLPKATSA